MSPVLSPQQSVELHQRLVSHAVHVAKSSQLAPVVLYVSDEHPFWTTFSDVLIKRQQGQCLGERMQRAMTEQLQSSERVVLIGADCPFIDAAYLALAIKPVDQPRRLTLGPARDGGYVLIASGEVESGLFDGVAWGSDQVLSQTLDRASMLGWQSDCLPVLDDIDRPDDLALLQDFHWMKEC